MAAPVEPPLGMVPPMEPLEHLSWKEWENWRDRFHLYRRATRLHRRPEHVQISWLVYAMGKKVVSIFRSFHLSSKTTYSEVIDAFDNYFKRKRVTVKRAAPTEEGRKFQPARSNRPHEISPLIHQERKVRHPSKKMSKQRCFRCLQFGHFLVDCNVEPRPGWIPERISAPVIPVHPEEADFPIKRRKAEPSPAASLEVNFGVFEGVENTVIGRAEYEKSFNMKELDFEQVVVRSPINRQLRGIGSRMMYIQRHNRMILERVVIVDHVSIPWISNSALGKLKSSPLEEEVLDMVCTLTNERPLGGPEIQKPKSKKHLVNKRETVKSKAKEVHFVGSGPKVRGVKVPKLHLQYKSRTEVQPTKGLPSQQTGGSVRDLRTARM